MPTNASFCDRCHGTFYATATLEIRDHPAVAKGTYVSGPDGALMFELCEACSVDLRDDWIKKGQAPWLS